MRKLIAIAFCAMAVLTSASIVSAQEGEIINNVCPVMGGKVEEDTPYKTEYEGKLIGFCCPDCVDTFKADPEKYMEKLEQKCMIKCPHCGAEIDVMEECKAVSPMLQDKE